MGNVVEET